MEENGTEMKFVFTLYVEINQSFKTQSHLNFQEEKQSGINWLNREVK